MNKLNSVLEICKEYLSVVDIDFTTTKEIRKNYGLDFHKFEKDFFEWRAVSLFKKGGPKKGLRLMLVNQDWLSNNKTKLSEIKAVIYHEIGHFLFYSENKAKREERAEEFAFFLAYMKKEKEVYKVLCEEAASYKVSPLKEHRKAYEYINTLKEKYKF